MNKLYVWEDVLCDYSCGIMVALAPSVEKARELVLKEIGDYAIVKEDLKREPKVVTKQSAFASWGGG